MIRILYEDRDLVVCEKPVGILSEPDGRRRNLPDLLKKQTRAYRIDVIHRLDQPVGGAMVYSKNARATPGLARQMADRTARHDGKTGFIKEYLTVVTGVPAAPAGEWTDWLFKDADHCKSRTVPPGTRGAKEASLSYRLLATETVDGVPLSLCKVRLHTGRTHQIRVQFSSRRLAVLGDTKYGSSPVENMSGIGLWSYRLAFRHPVTRRPLDLTCPPPDTFPWSLFDRAVFTVPPEEPSVDGSSHF